MTAPTVLPRSAVPAAPVDDLPSTSGIEELDITFVEAGDSVQRIFKMTNDNCGSTCQSACTTC
ncbi:FxLD family lanthipeptide [Actinoplanes sp. NPDC051859]|uniref:FxLD family lanthipeptide n=1 Tax=Actinoplanes sp. NPDC051859 TaxID=3363909 RepID=UPI00379CD33A